MGIAPPSLTAWGVRQEEPRIVQCQLPASQLSRAPPENMKFKVAIISFFVSSALLHGQSTNSGTVEGTVLDPSGAAIAGATVEVHNPVSHYSRSSQTDNQGKFQFPNIPYNNYHLSTSASGFQNEAQDINVRSGVPIELKINLEIGGSTTTVKCRSQR
jgi:uncharacterized membrane protein